MNWTLAAVISFLVLPGFASAVTEAPQPMVAMDEEVWIAFYDLPSRRFRDIRAAFLRQQTDRVARDLMASASHLTVEANRALPPIAQRLHEVAGRMRRFAEDTGPDAFTLGDLDSLFARAHWLLAQHYLDMARRSRDNRNNKNAGRYLWATAHHMERAVLWSDARITRELRRNLDDVRDLAARLQDDKRAQKAYRDRPMRKAQSLLHALGEHIDRPVVLPEE